MKNLKILREQSQLSQEDVAEKLGMSRPTYLRLERGDTEPNISQVKKLAEILGVTPESFLHDVLTEETNETVFKEYKKLILNCIEYGADNDGKITKTKLANLMYLVDFAWFYEHLNSLTGAKYRRLPQGPVSDLFFRAIDELFEEGALAINISGNAQMISKNETAPSLEEKVRQFIQQVCSKWQGRNTKEIVESTHNQIPWMICRPGEIIPYELITQEDNVY